MKKRKGVKIGGIMYTIIKRDNLEDKGEQVWGMIDYEKAIIYVRKSLSLQKCNQTFIHEVVHGLLHESGLDDYANDEKIVNPLGIVLYQLIKDNKSLI